MMLAGKIEQNCAKLMLTDFDAKRNVIYTLERSIDGKNFTEVERMVINGQKPVTFEAIFYDRFWYKAGAARVYYRIRATDIDGWFDFSPVVAVGERSPQVVMQLVEKDEIAGLGIFTLQQENVKNSSLKIFDDNGRLVKEEYINTAQAWIELPRQKPGKYKIQLASAHGVLENEVQLY